MKIRFIRQTTDGNQTYNPGQDADLPEVEAKTFIAAGWAEPVTEEAPGDEPPRPVRQGQPKQDE